MIRADEAVPDAIFGRRSCGNGPKARYSDWAMIATGIKGQYLLIRRLISRARLAFALHWSLQRRHQAIARWHHYSARRLAITEPGKQAAAGNAVTQ